jgi:cytochrome c oxidase subunit II
VIGLGLVFPTVTLVALLVYGVLLGPSVLPGDADRDPLIVDVRGHQWWWEIRYPDGPGGVVVHAANELHIPVGRPVHVRLTSNDVIHSFWVPQLGHKIDAMPGLVTYARLEASRTGVFRGQCAEFCGPQHARMSLLVYAHDPDEFERRLAELVATGDAIRQAAHPEAVASFDRQCAECHSRDLRERGPSVGPNLGAVTQRTMLGAGTLENNPNNRRRWVWDHQSLKPGNRMPIQAHLEPEVIESIVQMLEGRP